MFDVNYDTGAITMNVGDTGSFEVEAVRDDSELWTENDRAVFTIRNASGETVVERIYTLDNDDTGNGVLLIEFHNGDTDQLEPGSYTWELRFVVNPYYDGGTIVDGDIVQTPGIDGLGEPMPMTLKAVQADI